jgi:hypothetical protein
MAENGDMAIGLDFSGSDWLGIGDAVAGAAQGTAHCGARPLSGSTAEYDKCNQMAVQAMSEQARAAQDMNSKRQKVMIIGLVVGALTLVVITVIIARRRKNR